MNDKEIRGLFELAYRHCRSELGYFPKPRLVLETIPHKLKTHFYFLIDTIHVHRNTREPMYESLKHELVHSFIEYCNVRHKGIFTTYCKQVGAIYSGRIVPKKSKNK